MSASAGRRARESESADDSLDAATSRALQPVETSGGGEGGGAQKARAEEEKERPPLKPPYRLARNNV